MLEGSVSQDHAQVYCGDWEATTSIVAEFVHVHIKLAKHSAASSLTIIECLTSPITQY